MDSPTEHPQSSNPFADRFTDTAPASVGRVKSRRVKAEPQPPAIIETRHVPLRRLVPWIVFAILVVAFVAALPKLLIETFSVFDQAYETGRAKAAATWIPRGTQGTIAGLNHGAVYLCAVNVAWSVLAAIVAIVVRWTVLSRSHFWYRWLAGLAFSSLLIGWFQYSLGSALIANEELIKEQPIVFGAILSLLLAAIAPGFYKLLEVLLFRGERTIRSELFFPTTTPHRSRAWIATLILLCAIAWILVRNSLGFSINEVSFPPSTAGMNRFYGFLIQLGFGAIFLIAVENLIYEVLLPWLLKETQRWAVFLNLTALFWLLAIVLVYLAGQKFDIAHPQHFYFPLSLLLTLCGVVGLLVAHWGLLHWATVSDSISPAPHQELIKSDRLIVARINVTYPEIFAALTLCLALLSELPGLRMPLQIAWLKGDNHPRQLLALGLQGTPTQRAHSVGTFKRIVNSQPERLSADDWNLTIELGRGAFTNERLTNKERLEWRDLLERYDPDPRLVIEDVVKRNPPHAWHKEDMQHVLGRPDIGAIFLKHYDIFRSAPQDSFQRAVLEEWIEHHASDSAVIENVRRVFKSAPHSLSPAELSVFVATSSDKEIADLFMRLPTERDGFRLAAELARLCLLHQPRRLSSESIQALIEDSIRSQEISNLRVLLENGDLSWDEVIEVSPDIVPRLVNGLCESDDPGGIVEFLIFHRVLTGKDLWKFAPESGYRRLMFELSIDSW